MENHWQSEVSGDSDSVPDDVIQFLENFSKCLQENDTQGAAFCYDNDYNRLTEQYFKATRWPLVSTLEKLKVDIDPLFIPLYRELYHRHVYSKLQPTLEDRIDSFNNYVTLFEWMVGDDFQWELPSSWMWDILDEFVYHFQAFIWYRARVESLSDSEIEFLRKDEELWSAHSVLSCLKKFGEWADLSDDNAYRAEFGNYALISLLRLYCLLGNYHEALHSVEKLFASKRNRLSRNLACRVTLDYYVGVCCIMKGRWHDAGRVFDSILAYVSRMKQYHVQSYQFDNVQKKCDQMYSLLAIVHALCPVNMDLENVAGHLREKYGESVQRIQRGDTATAEQLFSYGCPKYLSPNHPDYSDPRKNQHSDASRVQLKVFMDEVGEHLELPSIRGFLKLYSSIPLEKLAKYMEVDVDEIFSSLVFLQNKGWQEVALNTNHTWNQLGEVSFVVEEGVVYVTDRKPTKDVAAYFVKQIRKFGELQRGNALL